MGRKLYVGNLPYSATETVVARSIRGSGTVIPSVSIISDRDTGQSKGFGFVEMATDAEAQAAIAGHERQVLDGRQIKVNEAKPQSRVAVVAAAAAVVAAATAVAVVVVAAATAGATNTSLSGLC